MTETDFIRHQLLLVAAEEVVYTQRDILARAQIIDGDPCPELAHAIGLIREGRINEITGPDLRAMAALVDERDHSERRYPGPSSTAPPRKKKRKKRHQARAAITPSERGGQITPLGGELPDT